MYKHLGGIKGTFLSVYSFVISGIGEYLLKIKRCKRFCVQTTKFDQPLLPKELPKILIKTVTLIYIFFIINLHLLVFKNI